MKTTILAKVCLIPAFILFCFLVNSCRSVKHVAKTISIESGEIPRSMASAEFGLIGILHEKRSIDKYTEKAFAQYPGPYKLATEKRVLKIYAKDSLYRYAIDYVKERSERFTAEGKKEISYGARYFIRDLETGGVVRRKGKSSFFYKELQALLKAIDRERTK